MRAPARLVGKRIKDAERRRPDSEAEPRSRGRLRLDEREASTKKVIDLRLFSRFGLAPNPQRHGHHVSLSLRHRTPDGRHASTGTTRPPASARVTVNTGG